MVNCATKNATQYRPSLDGTPSIIWCSENVITNIYIRLRFVLDSLSLPPVILDMLNVENGQTVTSTQNLQTISVKMLELPTKMITRSEMETSFE
jgi:lipid A disaccharide synthetase